MTAVFAKGNGAGSGTGVFIPPAKAGSIDDSKSFSVTEESMKVSRGESVF